MLNSTLMIKEDKSPGKEPAMEKGGKEERATQGMGREQWTGAVQKSHHRQGRERKKSQRTREGKQRGAVGVNFP